LFEAFGGFTHGSAEQEGTASDLSLSVSRRTHILSAEIRSSGIGLKFHFGRYREA
jgi:hypothetical protein